MGPSVSSSRYTLTLFWVIYETNIRLCSSVILIELLSSLPALRALRAGEKLFEKKNNNNNNNDEKGFLFKDRPARGY